MLATHVIETVGTQEYSLSRQRFLDRIASTYGDDSAADIGAHIRCPLP
jgi:adenosine kinase